MTTRLAWAVIVGFGLLWRPAAAETFNIRYDIYAGGFKALGMDARVTLAERTYDVEVALKTAGWIDWMLGFNQRIGSRGIVEAAVRPLLYQSEGVFLGKRRTTRLDYRDDGRIEATMIPLDEKDDRPPVPEAMKPGTIDPVSVLVAVNQAAAAGRLPCSGKAPVFDGRRRYNLAMEDGGVAAVAPTQYSTFTGPAVRCLITIERLGGFIPASRFNPETENRVHVVWLARFGESGTWLPVRLDSESTYGDVVGHLTAIDAKVQPLGRAIRSAS
jgi:hypothetical protein